MDRQTGVFVDLLDSEQLSKIVTERTGVEYKAEWFLTSGVISRFNPESKRLEIRTINTEGVQDRGFNTNPETGESEFNGQYAVYTYLGWHVFSREEILASLLNEDGKGKSVDLSEFVRAFGSRLEVNFSLAYAWVIEGDRD